MKTLATIKKATSLALVSAAVALVGLGGSVAAIPYQGEDTAGTATPQINAFTGVPSVGTESDFLRGRAGAPGTGGFTNSVQGACNNGDKFTVRTYIHNAADESLNASGQGIARGTRVSIALPSQDTASSFPLTGKISTTNAGSQSDGMTISCGNKKVKLSYLTGSARQFSNVGGVHPVSDSIVTPSGAPVGTMGADGNVLGCWDQRVYVTINVKVEEVQTPEQPEQPQKPEQPVAAPPAAAPAAKQEQVQSQPAALPATGPVGVGLIATAVSGISSLGYYLLHGRKF